MPQVIIGDKNIDVRCYTATDADMWDYFILQSRNGTFLHQQGYLSYHAERFPDASLIIEKHNRPIALLPATVLNNVLYSHRGLTYGGLIVGRDFHGADALPVFEAIRDWAKKQGLNKLIYKAIPHIYHRMPAEEDLYALTHLGGQLIRRDLSTTLSLSTRYAYSKGRKAAVSKALKSNLTVQITADYDTFMSIEAAHLNTKHGVAPVHTAAEIQLLASRFPDNIKLTAAFNQQQMLGGILSYTTDTVCHAQYIGATEEGKQMGVLDVCVNHLINTSTQIQWFDFGISTTNEGRYLDEALLRNKESWGGRTIVYDQYELVF
jgi:hypothetical protein